VPKSRTGARIASAALRHHTRRRQAELARTPSL